MKWFLFSIIMTTLVAECYGAAEQEFSQWVDVHWPVRSVTCKMPCQIVTKEDRFEYRTLIVADPCMRELPDDFAYQIAESLSPSWSLFDRKQLAEKSFQLLKQHLPVKEIAKGKAETAICLLITISKFAPRVVHFDSENDGTFAVIPSQRSLLGAFSITKDTRRLKGRDITPFDNLRHIKMLRELGRHNDIEELRKRYIPESLHHDEVLLEIGVPEAQLNCTIS